MVAKAGIRVPAEYFVEALWKFLRDLGIYN